MTDRNPPPKGDAPVGIVIGLFKGGCEVVHADRVVSLRLVGRHAQHGVALAVGDDVTFDPGQGIVLELMPRRTILARRRPRDDPRQAQVLAANMDRLAIISSVGEPPFRARLVDRLLLAAFAGGVEPLLVVNKIDLLQGELLPEEIRAFEAAVPVCAVSALTGAGLEALRGRLTGSRTVLAGHSGVGKTSIVNAFQPELRLETGELRKGGRRGRHTTVRAVMVRLPGEAIVVDTPGVREVGTGPVDPALLDRVYPDVAREASRCRFRDCIHDREPGCGVRAAIESGALSDTRRASFVTLLAEIRGES